MEKKPVTTSPIIPTAQANFGKSMSSREIAELTEKTHFHVMRDIKALIEQGAIGQSNFGLSSYRNSQNKEQPMYLLDFDATMTLVTGYNAVLRAKVIKRWRELETGESKPISQTPVQSLLPEEIMVRGLKASHEMALFFGLEGNQALLCADKAVRKLHGISPVALLEVDLKAPDNEALIIATEIGKRFDPPKSAKFINLTLADLGFQKKVERKTNKFEWRLTEKGKGYGMYVDVGKSHSDGTPIQQIKWKESVISMIAKLMGYH